MIASVLPVALLPDLIACALWTALVFVAGVAYAAYRAVGWVDRMRRWAYSTSIPEGETND